MSVIVSNKIVLNAKEARKETLDGRDFRVVPIVLMVDGVHTANAGALYYSPEVNSKNPDNWNQMPLVVYHPEINGKLVTARSPQIAEKRQVGYVYNAGYNKPKTGGEAWFDVEKTNKVDERIIKSIDAGETIEVSAGYVLDYEEKTGEANGEKYTGVVVNVNPDHVAILPDKKGACDVKKGCGCGVNVVNELKPLTANEASFSRIMSGISDAMMTKFGYCYIRDVYSDFFVYSQGYSGDQPLYKRNYTVDKQGDVTVADGEPTQVDWVMEYRDMKGNFVGNSSIEPKEIIVADKNAISKTILAYNAGYEEAELNGMDEPTLQATEKTLAKIKKANVANKTEPTPTPPVVPPVVPTPTPPAPTTAQEWLVANKAPAVICQIVNNALEHHANLVANIKANPNNKLSEAVLQQMDPTSLMSLQEMLTPAVQQTVGSQHTGTPWWGGQSVTVANNANGPTPLAPGNVFGGPPAK